MPCCGWPGAATIGLAASACGSPGGIPGGALANGVTRMARQFRSADRNGVTVHYDVLLPPGNATPAGLPVLLLHVLAMVAEIEDDLVQQQSRHNLDAQLGIDSMSLFERLASGSARIRGPTMVLISPVLIMV